MKPHNVLEVDPSIIERNLLITDRPPSPSPEIRISQLLGNTASAKKEDEDEVPCIHVRPTAGFCVKTHTLEGDKVFLNICHTEEIPSPKDILDDELIKILESDGAPSYTVPLSIGSLHIEADKGGNVCSVYDVAINTDFFNKILTNQLFKTFFMTIVIEGVQNKFGIELTLKSEKPYVILRNRKRIGEILPHRIQKRGPRQPATIEPQKKLIEVISSVDEPTAASGSQETSKPVPVSLQKGGKSAVSVDEHNKLRLFAVAPKNGDALLLMVLAKVKALTGSDVNLDVSSRRLIVSCERNETIDCVLPCSVQPEKAVAEYFVNLQLAWILNIPYLLSFVSEVFSQMADQLMDVISGASHGSYSFIHDNYIYRINKFTHKRVYLSCRLARCRGAGKGMKGATRGEVYGFKLSKPHNHPPEENKIKHFEVKEYVREEARCTRDTSKEIYERVVKLFDCYDLSRACVDGLVKRSRERTAGEVAEKTSLRRNSGKTGEDEDFIDSEDIMGRLVVPQHELERKLLNSCSAEDEEKEEENATYEEICQEVYEQEEVHEEASDEQFMEVVIKGNQIEQEEVPVEYVEVDEGVDQDIILPPDNEELVVGEEEQAGSSDSDSDLDGSYSPEEPSSESDSSMELDNTVVVVPRKRFKTLGGKPMYVPSQRLPEKQHHAVGASNHFTNRCSSKRRRLSDSEDDRPVEKRLTIEESLMKIFSSTHFNSKDNVFGLMSNPESIPGYGDEQNALDSTNSLNIIKSASKLCTFSAVKASQMRNILVGKTKELKVLEDVLLEHLSNLMCFSGTEFFQKCFGQTLREAIEQGKKDDQMSKAMWNEDEIYSKIEFRKNIMQLAVALLCYSGKAYMALGELIDLPGPHVARKWATNSEGNPGFSAQSFAAIRSAVSTSRSKTIFVCLSMEDVELKRHVDASSSQLFGYTDLGYGRVESDSIPEASRAVVFYASAINSHWKIPLGYCLADNLSPQVRTNLVSQYVSKLEFNGVKCVGIVLSSSAVSTQIYEEFGVIQKGALPLGAFHTNADEKIRVSPFVDIMEVMESVKQLWKEKGHFLTSAGDKISWSHLECVEEFVRSENADLGLVPGSCSLDFMNFLKSLKIKMHKDPWPFGRYYPAAMKILQKFRANVSKNLNPTLKFVEHMIEITEIFTSCNRFHEKKSCFTNDKSSFTAINKLIHYLENMKFPGGSFVKDEDRRMPIMNLCMNLSGLKVVLRRVFSQKDGLFHRLSLNNVREFLSTIRTRRELLAPVQFRKRYFHHIQTLDISPSGNLINRRRSPDKIREKFNLDSTFFSSKMYIYTPLRSMCDRLSNFFVQKVINIWIDAVDCPECFQVMLDSMQIENSDLLKDLFRLIHRVETELCVMSEIPVDLFGRKLDAFANGILNGLASFDGFKLSEHLFASSEFGSTCHFTYLVKNFIEIYLRLRFMYLTREVKIGINDFHKCSMRYYSFGQHWA